MNWLKLQLAAAFAGTQPLNRKVIALALVIAAAAAFGLNYFVSQTANEQAATKAEESLTKTEAATVELPKLYVHIVGEVVKPGIYLLETGSRLIDAVFASGGFTKDADQSSVNLARSLSDGEQIIVLGVGQSSGPLSLGGNQSGGLISLNRASALELEALPGVGPALAARMVDWRNANGGFKSKDELQSVSGIGDKMFAAIEKLVTL